MSLPYRPLPRPTLSPASITRLQSAGHDPIIPGNSACYPLTTLRFSSPTQTPTYRRTTIPSIFESPETLIYIFSMNREFAGKVWDEYVDLHRRMKVEAIKRRFELEEDDDYFGEVADKVFYGREGRNDGDETKVAETMRLMDEVIGLNEFILSWGLDTEAVGAPNGMDENAKLEYRRCMIGAGITNEALVRSWTEEAWSHLSQLGNWRN